MEYAQLGQTGLKVSKVCLGTMTMGNGQMPESDAHAQLDYALAGGVNFLDTAEVYAIPMNPETSGKTEQFIGNWLAKNQNKRADIILATKINPKGPTWIRDGRRATPQDVATAVEGSLKRLQTDYIDLYQLHRPTRPYPHHQQHWTFAPATDAALEVEYMHSILDMAGQLVKQGKIRSIGLSNDSPWGLMTYLNLAEKHNLPRIASVQNEYSLLYRLDDMYMEEMCTLEKVAFLPYSPLAMGLLTGKYQNGAMPQNSRATLPGNSTIRRITPLSMQATQAYANLAQQHGLTLIQLALAFMNERPYVTSTIIGATTLEQLKEDLAAFNTQLTPEAMAGIDTIRRQFPLSY